MGCDIHVFAEQKTPEGWKLWPKLKVITKEADEGEKPYVYLESLDLGGRSYAFFNDLAGVRGLGPGMFPSRGIPKNCCKEIKADFRRWKYDAHSASYATDRELVLFKVRYPKYTLVHKGLAPLYEAGLDFRIIFWFDN